MIKIVLEKFNLDMISGDFAHYWVKKENHWIPLGEKGKELDCSAPVKDNQILDWLFSGFCVPFTLEQFLQETDG